MPQHRRTIASPLFASLLLFLSAVSSAAVTAQENSDAELREYAKARQGQYFYGIYMMGGKVGWMSETTRLGNWKDTEVMISEQRGEIRLQLFGTENRLDFRSQMIYGLTGDGKILFAEEKSEDGDSKSHSTAIAEPEGYSVTLKAEGQSRRFKTSPSRDRLKNWIEVENWLLAERQSGDTRKGYSFDFDKLSNTTASDERVSPDEEEVMTYMAQRKSRWGGVPVMLTEINAKMGTIDAKVEVLPDGTPVTMSFGPMKARLEEEQTAKNIEMVVGDMLAFVPTEKDMGPPERVRKATIELRGLGEFDVPTTARQQVTEKREDFALLDLDSSRKAPESNALGVEQIKGFTASTLRVQADHKRIIDLTKEIVGQEKDTLKRAGLIQNWVFQNIRGSYSSNADTAVRVLDNKAGDCTENALLFVTMARSVGIPAREVSGLIFSSEPKPGFYWHAWAEIHNGKQWVGIDPSFNQVGLDAAHIKMDEDAASYRAVGVMGQLKIRVKDFQASR